MPQPWTWHQMQNGACVVNDDQGRIIAMCPIHEGLDAAQVARHAEAIADLSKEASAMAKFWAEKFPAPREASP